MSNKQSLSLKVLSAMVKNLLMQSLTLETHLCKVEISRSRKLHHVNDYSFLFLLITAGLVISLLLALEYVECCL